MLTGLLSNGPPSQSVLHNNVGTECYLCSPLNSQSSGDARFWVNVAKKHKGSFCHLSQIIDHWLGFGFDTNDLTTPTQASKIIISVHAVQNMH